MCDDCSDTVVYPCYSVSEYVSASFRQVNFDWHNVTINSCKHVRNLINLIGIYENAHIYRLIHLFLNQNKDRKTKNNTFLKNS